MGASVLCLLQADAATPRDTPRGQTDTFLVNQELCLLGSRFPRLLAPAPLLLVLWDHSCPSRGLWLGLGCRTQNPVCVAAPGSASPLEPPPWLHRPSFPKAAL